MDSSPPNPFSGADNSSAADNNTNNNDGDNFDAFALSPVSAAKSSPMPSLQSIQMQEQQMMQSQRPQQQQQQQQQLKFDGLPSPQELQMSVGSGPMNNDASGTWPPPPPPLGNARTTNDDNNNNNNNNNAGGDQNRSFLSRLLTCGGMCSVQALRPYFDVDTADVVVRMKGAVRYCAAADGFRNEVLYSDNALRLAYRENDVDGGGEGTSSAADANRIPEEGGGNYQTSSSPSGGKGPDLYGPVWITLTLVFLVAVTSNMSLFFHHSANRKSIVDEGGAAAEEEWDYDINQLLHATWILYSFSVGLPSVLYFLMKLMGVGGGGSGGGGGLGLAELICLYGYSLVPYLPAAWLCVAPSGVVKWMALAAATAVSGTLVLRNVAGSILASGGGAAGVGGGGVQGKSGGLIMCLVGCHFVFFLVMKLAFYHHT